MNCLNMLLVFTCLIIPIVYIFVQLKKCYAASLILPLLYMALISYLTVSKRLKLLALALMIWGISLWALYYIIPTPTWILANGDLLCMSKVAEETVEKGRYPFNDTFLVSKRPNYVFYPVPFLLQATLSIVTGIGVQTLMYVPILMLVSYLLIVITTLLVVKSCPNEFIPFAVIPILSFLSPRPIYFVYSHIARTILLLLTYIVFVKLKFKDTQRSILVVVVLLTTSSVLGHSQEPITYLILNLLLFIALAIIRRAKTSLFTYTLLFFIALLFTHNIYVSTQVSKSIVSWLYERFLTALLPEASPEVVIEKTSIAQSVLTLAELIVMITGFAVMALYVSIIMIWKAVKTLLYGRNYEVLATVIALLTYGLIALIPLFVPNIGTDLYWRPLWSLFVILSIWNLMFDKTNKTVEIDNRYGIRRKAKSIAIPCLICITIILFGISNFIYLRHHLISSDVYVHEATTLNIIYYSSLLRYLNMSRNLYGIMVVDSPRQPVYEVSRALVYIHLSEPDHVILVLEPEIRYYMGLKYLNDVVKSRAFEGVYSVMNPVEGLNNFIIIGSIADVQSVTLHIIKNLVFSLGDIGVFV